MIVSRTSFTGIIRQTATEFQLDADLLEAQVLVESAGNPNAFRFEQGFFTRYVQGSTVALGVSYGPLAACSYGLLQIMLETALEIGFTGRPEMLFTPTVGLWWGAKFLEGLMKWSEGDTDRALAAYNGGRRGNFIPPLRNQGYVDKVLRMRDGLLAGPPTPLRTKKA